MIGLEDGRSGKEEMKARSVIARCFPPIEPAELHHVHPDLHWHKSHPLSFLVLFLQLQFVQSVSIVTTKLNWYASAPTNQPPRAAGKAKPAKTFQASLLFLFKHILLLLGNSGWDEQQDLQLASIVFRIHPLLLH